MSTQLNRQAGHRLGVEDWAVARFAVSVNEDNGAARPSTVVRVVGEVDFSTAPALKQTIVGVLRDESNCVIVDVRSVEFIDATGIGVLVGAANRARGMGTTLALRAPSQPVRRYLELLELDGALPVDTGSPDDS